MRISVNVIFPELYIINLPGEFSITLYTLTGHL